MEFGELRMESSRAFWDDYDEDEEQEFPKLEWVWHNENNTPQFPTSLETLLIVEGATVNVTDFFNSILLKGRSPSCQLKIGQASVYEFAEHKLAICIVDEKDLNYFSPITQILDPWIKVATNVRAITFQSTATFRGDDMAETIDGCFLRAVNPEAKTRDYVKELEVPNVITGVSAGIISYCKYVKRQATCYVVFMESPIFDSITTRPMIRLLKDLNIPCDDTFVFKKHKSASSLYL